jgi:membrane-bound metal-dependent hydrolase YbcI (DUF457 family)
VPSTVVHVALAWLVAAALLDRLDRRALFVITVAVVVPDLDAFSGIIVQGTHRAMLHTLLIPGLAAAGLAVDTRWRNRSWVRDRLSAADLRLVWVTILAVAVAAIGLDLVTGGANPFYPIHDQFYRVNGKFILSTQRGLVQTFVEIAPNGAVDAKGLGSTKEVHVSSGVDPNRGQEPENVDRVFPIVRSGWQLLLVASSLIVVGLRKRADPESERTN